MVLRLCLFLHQEFSVDFVEVDLLKLLVRHTRLLKNINKGRAQLFFFLFEDIISYTFNFLQNCSIIDM